MIKKITETFYQEWEIAEGYKSNNRNKSADWSSSPGWLQVYVLVRYAYDMEYSLQIMRTYMLIYIPNRFITTFSMNQKYFQMAPK
jgi:hypothetical protein